MPIALVFNPGSNSLKFELLELASAQRTASDAKKLASAGIDNIGKPGTQLSVYKGRDLVLQTDVSASNMTAAVHAALDHLHQQSGLASPNFLGVRVVHGGELYDSAVRATDHVRRDIARFEELAPLHNQSSLDILDVLDTELPDTPTFVTFDTAFHRTLPEIAWRYAIERATADRYGIRKFGFHGLSHRYMLEHFAATLGRPPAELSLVTLHLESGCSACAIREGKSVDTTMGMTPLEGLMMGSRSGSIDPAIPPFLMEKEHLSGNAVLDLLNKRSGMLGIAGGSLDTRVLEKRASDEDDPAARLALAMFSYRVRLAVGAYLAALGSPVDAVLFGGGIGEDSPWLREAVCEGLTGWGLKLDRDANRSTAGMTKITTADSRLAAWAIPVEEGLQLAHECLLALNNT